MEVIYFIKLNSCFFFLFCFVKLYIIRGRSVFIFRFIVISWWSLKIGRKKIYKNFLVIFYFVVFFYSF